MKNDFRENGYIRVRTETQEETAEIVRILEEKQGIGIRGGTEQGKNYPVWYSRTIEIDMKRRTFFRGVCPFIGAAMLSSGIRFYSAQEFFRLAACDFSFVPRFPVFHVPHDGRCFPAELTESVYVPEEVFLRYHEEMRDAEISRAVPDVYRGGHMCAAFPVSRLLCDVERLTGPEEVIERYGMGFCYEKAYDGTAIKRVTEELKEKTLRYYREHQERMNRICRQHPRILLFDLHSWHDKIVPVGFLREEEKTPDLCIGTDGRFTPPELTEIMIRKFSEAGFRTAVNRPYSGCFIPDCAAEGHPDATSSESCWSSAKEYFSAKTEKRIRKSWRESGESSCRRLRNAWSCEGHGMFPDFSGHINYSAGFFDFRRVSLTRPGRGFFTKVDSNLDAFSA